MLAGGLVGNNDGTISNSYATGAVSGTSGFFFVFAGGLVGRNSGTIRNSYATGAVTAISQWRCDSRRTRGSE